VKLGSAEAIGGSLACLVWTGLRWDVVGLG
jgi:hypothetical protein